MSPDPASAKRRRDRGPDFLCIGAQKAATTWLYRNLADHPGIWLPEHVKEFHYFDDRAELLDQTWRRKLRGERRPDVRWRRRVRTRLGTRTLSGLRWDARFYLRRPSDSWYRSLFVPAGTRITGDMTPDYLALPKRDIAVAAEVVPDARIILMIRNPIERLWSAVAYFRGQAKGRAGRLERDEVLKFISSPRNLRLTDYIAGLRRWRDHYPADRVFVGFTDDVTFNPAALLAAVHRFLGLDPAPAEAADERVNWTRSRDLPGWAAVALAEGLDDQLARSARHFGLYARWWRHVGRRLIELGPEVSHTYPLTDGELWDGWWDRSRPPRLQSGVLSDIAPRL